MHRGWKRLGIPRREVACWWSAETVNGLPNLQEGFTGPCAVLWERMLVSNKGGGVVRSIEASSTPEWRKRRWLKRMRDRMVSTVIMLSRKAVQELMYVG